MMLEGLEEGGLVLSPALQTGALGLLLSGELRLCSGDLLRCRTRAGGGAALTSPVHRWVGDEQGDDTVPSSGGVGLPCCCCCFSWNGTVALMGCRRLPDPPAVATALPPREPAGVGDPLRLTRWDMVPPPR